MSSTVPAEFGGSGALYQAVTDPDRQEAAGCNDFAEKDARHVESSWRDLTTIEYLNNEKGTSKMLLPQKSLKIEESAEPNYVESEAREAEAGLERSLEQPDTASQALGSDTDQDASPGNCSQRETLASTSLRTGEEVQRQAQELNSMFAEDVIEVHTSETVENHESVETPLFGTSSQKNASSTAQGSTVSLEYPAPDGVNVTLVSPSREQVLVSASPPGQLVSGPAGHTGPHALPEQASCNGINHTSADQSLTSPEEVLLPHEKEDVRDGDILDIYEGGNEPASSSSWCLSVSTSSDTRSDTQQVLQCPEVHPRLAVALQQQTLTPQTQAASQERGQLLACIGTSADGSSSQETSDGNPSLTNGLNIARTGFVRETKDLHSATYEQCAAYGKAKIATDVLAGLTGMQPVAIINCFICEAPLGGVLSMFCFFSSAFAHFDKRPASYFLCCLLAFAFANTLIIALSLRLAGFENFHTVQLLRRMSVAHTVVLFVLSILAGGLGVRALWASAAHGGSYFWGKRFKGLKRHREWS